MILGQALLKEGSKISWRKERKFFLLDPFIARSLAMWSATPYLESAIYEWIVQSHLMRRFGSVFYYRNSYEVDAIADDLKIEVKVGKPHRRYPKGVTVLDSEDIPLFLALL